jgi:hypothetical protein
MTSLPTLPSLPGISSSTGTNYSGMTPDQVDDAMSAPMTDAEINQALGYNATGTSSSAAPAATTSATPTSIASSTPTPSSNATISSSGVISSIWSIVTGNIENGIFVVLGLMLIAAGVFSFKAAQTIVTSAGKAGKTVAEVAA